MGRVEERCAVAAGIERAASENRLSLCIVLTHADCTAHSSAATTSATAIAQRRRVAIERAHALLTQEQLLAASDPLRARTEARSFAVVAATIDARTARVQWLVPRAETMPIAPVR